MKMPLKKANILIPKDIDMTKWSVIACDQYTSEPEYWKKVKKLVGKTPSTLNLTLPEVYLESKDVNKRIKNINKNMDELLSKDFFKEYKDSMIYVERTQSDGKVREGLIGMVDLEDYSYEVGSKTLIRATEKTVVERIPPRVKVRENASLELPHIMILIDNEKKNIIESLKNKVKEEDVVYDFDLMKNGGHVKGYAVKPSIIEEINLKLNILMDQNTFESKYDVKDEPVLLFAMGDGNHSLATAKACYENLKKKIPKEEYLKHPSRYALVEIVNLHSDALEFEAIHRVVFGVDSNHLLEEMSKYYEISYSNGSGQKIEYFTKNKEGYIYIKNPKSNLSVGSLQLFLDDYLKKNPGKIDYVHGEDVTMSLGKKEGNISFVLPAMKKEELFKTVILDGALPRKTFSIGHSNDKRYYLESRKIK